MHILFSINFFYKNVQREPKLILSCITEAVIVGWDCRRDEASQPAGEPQAGSAMMAVTRLAK